MRTEIDWLRFARVRSDGPSPTDGVRVNGVGVDDDKLRAAFEFLEDTDQHGRVAARDQLGDSRLG